MLIDMGHGVDAEELAMAAVLAKQDHPTFAVGLNSLGLPLVDGLELSASSGLDATWVDDAGARAGHVPEIFRTSQQLKDIRDTYPLHRAFLGVDFKYTTPNPGPLASAKAVAGMG